MKSIIILTTLIFFAPNLVSDSYEDEVRQRLGLKGQICKQDESCGVKSMPGVGVKSNKTELVAVSEGRDGKTVYDLGCAACHNAGLAGAPLLGDQAQWASRLDKGLQTLTDNAYNGYNAMPAKGLCMDCTREEIEQSVQYMLDALTVN